MILGRTHVPVTDTVDIVFWWTDNEEPTAEDISAALSAEQTETVRSVTADFAKGDLKNKSMTAKRDESSFKYVYFAWPANFFTPEPTKIDTGFGGPSTWISSNVQVNGVMYLVLTVEVKNNSVDLSDYGLIQEGVL